MPTDYTNLPNNSKAAQKAQQPAKDIPHAKPVAEGQVVEEKEAGGFVRLLRIFFAMSLREMWQRVKKEVLLPSAKNMAHDIGSSALDLMLYGDDVPFTTSSSTRTIPYNEISTKRVDAPIEHKDTAELDGATQTFKIKVRTNQEAEKVKKELIEYLTMYGKVPVAYAKELVKQPTISTDYEYGWTSLDGSHISQYRNEMIVTLPKPKPME